MDKKDINTALLPSAADLKSTNSMNEQVQNFSDKGGDPEFSSKKFNQNELSPYNGRESVLDS